MNIISDIGEYLEDQSVGAVGTSIFLSKTVDTPDNVICIFDNPSHQPDRYIPTAVPDFQVYVRNKSYTAGKTKADSIMDLLHQKANVELISGSNYFYYIMADTEVMFIGRDDKGRCEFSVNFTTKVKR